MYLSVKFGGRDGPPPPYELTRAQVCERMGWQLDYYDSLDWSDVLGLLQVWDGLEKARAR